MSWHYRIRHRVDQGHNIYDIVEFYENPTCWSRDGMAPLGETKEELLKDLERMLEDARYYQVLEDTKPDDLTGAQEG